MNSHLPAPLRHISHEIPRVLTVATARELGMSRHAIEHAIATRGWRRLARGILLTVPDDPGRADWINVGLELAAPSGAISGWDAVRIAGLGAAQPPRPEVLVLARAGEHRVVGRVRIRPTRRSFTTWILPGDHPDHPFGEIVCTARAVADTALQYRRFVPVRALVTSAVQRRRCTAEDLIAQLEDGPRNDSALLRRALADVRRGALSIAEAEAIDILRRAVLPPFEANVPLVSASGLLIGVADCLWRELRAVMEINGRAFHFSEEDWNKTMARHNRLTRHGLSVAHHAPSELRGDSLAWAKGVDVWLRARAAELGIAYRPVRDPLVVPAVPGKPRPFVVPDLRSTS